MTVQTITFTAQDIDEIALGIVAVACDGVPAGTAGRAGKLMTCIEAIITTTGVTGTLRERIENAVLLVLARRVLIGPCPPLSAALGGLKRPGIAHTP